MSWLKTKQGTTIFALIALISGFIFLNQSTLTGNIISAGEGSFNLISFIGLLLISCSIILAVYAIVKK